MAGLRKYAGSSNATGAWRGKATPGRSPASMTIRRDRHVSRAAAPPAKKTQMTRKAAHVQVVDEDVGNAAAVAQLLALGVKKHVLVAASSGRLRNASTCSSSAPRSGCPRRVRSAARESISQSTAPGQHAARRTRNSPESRSKHRPGLSLRPCRHPHDRGRESLRASHQPRATRLARDDLRARRPGGLR